MSKSTIYKKIRTLKSNLNMYSKRCDSFDPSAFNSGIGITECLYKIGIIRREIWALEELLKSK